MAERASLPPGEVIASLKATSLFSLLEPEELVRLAPLFAAVRVRAGEPLTRAGELDAGLWVVVDGVVVVGAPDRPDPAELQYRSFGDTIGARGVFTGAARQTAATAYEESVLIRASRDALLARLAADPELFDRLVLDDDVRARLSLEDLPSAAAGEYRVALYRKHWVVLAKRLALPAALLVATIGAAALLSALSASGPGASPALVLAIATVAVGLPIGIGLWAFFDYYHDVLIVTNRRIVHIERTPFIDTQRTEAFLTRVQDVNWSVSGVWGRLLGYGTLTVQTASTSGRIAFAHMPRPESARAIIVTQLEGARDAVRRERDEWVNERVRRAIGIADASPPEAPFAPSQADPSAEPFGALVLEALAQMAGYFWPKMRLEEGAVITWRKHWMVLVRALVRPVLLLLLAALLAAWLAGRDVSLPPAAAAAIGVVLLGWVLWQYENWRNDLYQVTEEHVIDIERLPFGFSEERRQASLSQIQDVRYRIPNPVATLFNFGNVVIQTAAEQGSFTFDSVYAPSRVQAEIFDRIQRHQERIQREEEERRAEEMVVWLRTYHDIATDGAAEGRPQRPPLDVD